MPVNLNASKPLKPFISLPLSFSEGRKTEGSGKIIRCQSVQGSPSLTPPSLTETTGALPSEPQRHLIALGAHFHLMPCEPKVSLEAFKFLQSSVARAPTTK